MRSKLPILLCGTALVVSSLAAADKQVEIAKTEHLDLAPGGTVRLERSFGTVTAEGWDQLGVEITISKSRDRFYAPNQEKRIEDALQHVSTSLSRKSDGELIITTTLPPRHFTRSWGDKNAILRVTGAALDKVTSRAMHPMGGHGGLLLEYQLRVPRDCRLVIHHRDGEVLISGVVGDVETTSTGGDILVMLPDGVASSIDARAKFGTVSSDFEGAARRRHLVGSGFARKGSESPSRIFLRTRNGGIAIKAIPSGDDFLKSGMGPR